MKKTKYSPLLSGGVHERNAKEFRRARANSLLAISTIAVALAVILAAAVALMQEVG